MTIGLTSPLKDEGNPFERYRAECNLSIVELEPDTSFQTIVWNEARDL